MRTALQCRGLPLASSTPRPDPMKKTLLACLGVAALAATAISLPAQPQTGPAPALPYASDAGLTDYSKWSQPALEAELARRAIIERKVLMPMRDGVGLSTDIYRPKDATGPVPTIFVRTPYNMNTLQGGTLRQVVEAIDRGYAYIGQNERGRYFSEGKFEILGYPRTDGYDALTWIADQSWSNKKVGTYGCSSTAEWQLQLAATNHPAHAAMVPMASGAGIGRVGEFHEQGNWYRGGVPRTLFSIWLYGVDNPLRGDRPGGGPAAQASAGQRDPVGDVAQRIHDLAQHDDGLAQRLDRRLQGFQARRETVQGVRDRGELLKWAVARSQGVDDTAFGEQSVSDTVLGEQAVHEAFLGQQLVHEAAGLDGPHQPALLLRHPVQRAAGRGQPVDHPTGL